MRQYTSVNVRSLPGAPLIHLHLRVFMNSAFVRIILKGAKNNKQTDKVNVHPGPCKELQLMGEQQRREAFMVGSKMASGSRAPDPQKLRSFLNT